MDEIEQRLHGMDWKITETKVNCRGRHVHMLKHRSGKSVAMFQEDAADLVEGRAKLEEIIARNKGADLADPWPVA